MKQEENNKNKNKMIINMPGMEITLHDDDDYSDETEIENGQVIIARDNSSNCQIQKNSGTIIISQNKR